MQRRNKDRLTPTPYMVFLRRGGGDFVNFVGCRRKLNLIWLTWFWHRKKQSKHRLLNNHMFKGPSELKIIVCDDLQYLDARAQWSPRCEEFCLVDSNWAFPRYLDQ